MGRGRKRRHARLPRPAPCPSGHLRPVDGALRLSEGGRARAARRLLLLFPQRRPSKPVGAVAQALAHGSGRTVPRSEYPFGRRYDGARRRLVLRRRPLVRVCRRRSRFGLGADTCRGYRDGSVDAGCDRMGEVLRRDMGPRLRRVLLQRLRRAEGERLFIEERMPEGLLPPSGYGAGRRHSHIRRSGASAALFQRLGERRRPLAFRPRVGRYVGQ